MTRIRIEPDTEAAADAQAIARAKLLLLGDPLATRTLALSGIAVVNLRADRSTWDATSAIGEGVRGYSISDFMTYDRTSTDGTDSPITALTARAIAAIALGPRQPGTGGRYARAGAKPARLVYIRARLGEPLESAVLRAANLLELASTAVEGVREVAAWLDENGHGTLGTEVVAQAMATWPATNDVQA